jgi:TonB family protein
MACPHCHAEVGASDLFCFACGAQLEPLPPASATGAPAADSAPSLAVAPPRRGLRLLLIILVNLCLLVASAWMAYALLQRHRAAPVATVFLGTPRQVELDAGRAAPAPAAAADTSGSAAAPGEKASSPAKGKGTKRTGAPTRGGPPVAATQDGTSLAAATPTRPSGGDHGAASQPASPAEPATPAPRPGDSKPSKQTPEGAGGGDAAETAGTLNADNVRMVVRHYLPQVHACYDRALKQQGSISGVVEVKFEVSNEGRVRSSTVHSNSTGHDGLGKCIAAVLKSWKFPRPVGGGAVFIYPFVFSPGD